VVSQCIFIPQKCISKFKMYTKFTFITVTYHKLRIVVMFEV